MSASGDTAPASMRPVILLSMAGFCTMATMRVAEPLLPAVAADICPAALGTLRLSSIKS